jgi:branched-chain amino acid aminotransferase
VTPPTGNTVLDGVTRRSVLAVAPQLGLDVVERPVAVDELGPAGRYTEAFACGTAAVIVPIGRVRSRFGEVTIGDGGPGRLTMRIRDHLVAIQEGRLPDPSGWLTRVGT